MTDQKTLFEKMRAMRQELMRGGPQAATAAIQDALQKAKIGAPGFGGNTAGFATGATAATGMPTGRGPAMRDINPPPAGKGGNHAADAATAAAAPIADPKAEPKAEPAAEPARPGVRDGGPAASARAQPATSAGKVKRSAASALDGMSGFVPDLLAKLGVSADGIQLGKMPGAGRTAAPLPEGAQFLSGSHANQAGSRQYKLYVPASYHGQALPLVVMLHGCTQDPDDFAAGTQMNAAAEAQQCLVLYPQQSQAANSSKCWNWFSAGDQQRDAGEPSIIAGMTREVAEKYKIDPAQIYIAGLSAGGAMAAIMGTTYPELYAGVAVHSGLPYGAATDLPSALSAMKSGMTRAAPHAQQASGTRAFKGIPIIVFHGDADHTVNVRNGEQVLVGTAPSAGGADRVSRQSGQVANGHAYTRTVHKDADGKPVAEHWLIHGFGHAWAGGSAAGSYTDARGPDATGEMMRFFYTHSKSA